MAQIESGHDQNIRLRVDPVSLAARAALFSGSGVPAIVDDNEQPAEVAGLPMMALNDRILMPIRGDRFGSLASALHAPLASESFEGGTTHATRWNVIATTMAAAQTTVGGLVFNSGNITTINTGYLLQSSRRFTKTQRNLLQCKPRVRLNHVNNCVMEFGFGNASTFNGAHTAGAYWQLSSAGVLQPVVTYNGVDQTGADVRSLLNNANFYTFDVCIDDDEAIFFVQDTATGLILSQQSIKLPLTGQRLLSETALPVFARLYNTGVAPASAPQMILTDLYVAGLDQLSNRPWSHAMASQERHSAVNPFSGAQLANYANSAAPANATLSNTAAGYATLGGLFGFAAVAGAATDYALFGFAVPAGANLTITGVDIETWNTGAAVATTPHLLAWSLGVGSTAVSLATATVNRVPIGAQSFAVGAAIGAKAERISKSFQSPLHVPSGRFLHVILRMPVATATASQVLQGLVGIEGYFD